VIQHCIALLDCYKPLYAYSSLPDYLLIKTANSWIPTNNFHTLSVYILAD